MSRSREKYLARQRRYNVSPKGRARYERYDSMFIRVPEYLGSRRGQPPIRVPRTPKNEAKVAAVLERRDQFEQQSDDGQNSRPLRAIASNDHEHARPRGREL